jgi:hypothetical protein
MDDAGMDDAGMDDAASFKFRKCLSSFLLIFLTFLELVFTFSQYFACLVLARSS